MLGAEAYYYVNVDTPNDMPSDFKETAKSLMVGRKNNQSKKTLGYASVLEHKHVR